MFDAIDVQSLGMEFGTGAVVGAIVGYASKKLAKVVAVIIGIQLALFKFLESRGILTVDWDRLGATFLDAGYGAAGTPPSWLQSILSTLSISAGFTGGFLLGWRRG